MVQLTTNRLVLHAVQKEDAPLFKDFELRNAAHFATSGPNYNLDDRGYQELIEKWVADGELGTSIRLFLYSKENMGQIIGICSFTNIIRGPFQACYLGYKIDQAHEGKGLMYEAVQAAISYVFDELNLHRIMANYMPANARSGKLVERLGFVVEGTAKEYLLISGKWEDHVMTSLINKNWKQNIDK